MNKATRSAQVTVAIAFVAAMGLSHAFAQSNHDSHHSHQHAGVSSDASHSDNTGGGHGNHSPMSHGESAENETDGRFNGHSDDMMMLHGSATLAKLLEFPHKQHLEAAVGKQIHVVANGSATGLIDLVNGRAEVAMVSAPVSDIRQSLELETPGALGDTRFTEYRVGTTTASFIIHPSNPVRSISEDRMRDVLTGKITNWKSLGGHDQPIVLLVTKPGDGARSLIEMQLLKGQKLTPSARKIAALPQVVQIISQLPNGIGLSDGSMTSDQVVTVSGVKIEQALNFVTTGPPTEPVRKLIEMASQMAASQ
jgi:ABC-type phosphate transport system substrate-binding protein